MIGVFIVFVAVFVTILGFQHSFRARLRRECEEHGHRWESDYTGLECARCGQRF